MQTFTTKVAAEVAGVHQQTVIRWARQGFLKPSVPRRKWEPRRYTEQDLAALMIASTASNLVMPREDAAEIAKMAQNPDEKQQRNAALIAVNMVKELHGFVFTMWFSNVKDPKQAKTIERLGKGGYILQQLNFYDVVQTALKKVREKYVDKKLASTELETE